MKRALRNRVARRCVTLPLTLIAATAALVASPITVALAALVDRGKPWQRTRLVALVTGALVIEAAGLVGALIAWIATGCGLAPNRRWSWPIHRRLMGWYTSTLLAWIARVTGAGIEWRIDRVDEGPIVVLARHTSFFDALIPAALVSHKSGLVAHHVITDGLKLIPNLDVVGHRIPTRFIRRTRGSNERQLDSITEIGELLDERSAAIIFPEGTFRDDDRFARRIDRLERRDPELAARARSLRHVLPPQPLGTIALLKGCPENTTVVMLANTGLEAFSTLAEIVASLEANGPIVIDGWTTERAAIPIDNDDATGAWLFDQYRRLDDWVEANRVLPT